MKIIIALVTALFLLSCEKKWTCDCIGADGNITEQYEFKAYEDDAVESCESTQTNYRVYVSDMTCELKPR
jgi:hypothetical protein